MSLLTNKVQILKNASPYRAHVIWVILFVSTFSIFYFLVKDSLKQGTERESEAVSPVDYSKDIDKYTCYQNRIPKEVMDICDKAFLSQPSR